MEPFSPQDPLARLLGKAGTVQPRSNFTQDVLRAVRQLPRQESGWERIKGMLDSWLFTPRPVMAGVCGLLAAVLFGVWTLRPAPETHSGGTVTVAKTNSIPATSATTDQTASTETDVVTELDRMGQFSQLLAQQDAHSLSDSELAALLY